MKYRLLAAFPIVVAVIFLVTTHGDPVAPALRPQVEVFKSLDLIGCLVAAFAFGRGDYLRRAWALTATCAAMLLLRDVTLRIGSPTHILGVPADLVDGVMVLVANTAAVAGLWMMARAWTIAGLEPPGSVRGRRILVGAAIVFACAVGATTIFLDARQMLRGDLAAIVPVASDVGDVLSILFIAPVALTALGMSGGALLWPWGLLTASVVCWLGYDVATMLRLMPGADTSMKMAGETFRALACTYTFAAGVAQRWAVRRR
jgi:hypothetical protein